MSLRAYKLDAAREAVLRAAKFRSPQRKAFETVHNLIRGLDNDLPKIDAPRLLQQLKEYGLTVSKLPPDLVFELATGVGKTRLMGAVIAYLYRAGQSRNAVILASRSTIVEKLERECQEHSSRYLLLDPSLVPEPNLCFRGTLEAFEPDPKRLNLYVLSPQTITGSDRRFARRTDFGRSTLEYLKSVPDLVVYVDESHHLQGRGKDESTAWREAVAHLDPRLQFGFSATPLSEATTNILYSYGLAECLRDGLYTKAVKLWVETTPADISEDDWDRVTLDFGLQRLERKRNALRAYAEDRPEFAFVEPVMLVAARDTEHAEAVGTWLKEKRGLLDDEIHVAHSHRHPSEDELNKLVAIDRPGNRIRVVVNVFQLSEGWDVTNVYVVAPLRAMATYQNAVQSMGRGLRLPAGRRLEEPELDTLDVLCFGRETFEGIVDQAMRQFGRDPDGMAAIALAQTKEEDDDYIGATKTITIEPRLQIEIKVPEVRRIPPEPTFDFDVTKIPEVQVVSGIDVVSLDRFSAEDDVLRYNLSTVIRNATLRIISDYKYLSPAVHYERVEKLVRSLLDRLGAKEDGDIAIDPVKVALLVGGEINKHYINQPVRFETVPNANTITPQRYKWRVPENLDHPIPKSGVTDWE